MGGIVQVRTCRPSPLWRPAACTRWLQGVGGAAGRCLAGRLSNHLAPNCVVGIDRRQQLAQGGEVGEPAGRRGWRGAARQFQTASQPRTTRLQRRESGRPHIQAASSAGRLGRALQRLQVPSRGS